MSKVHSFVVSEAEEHGIEKAIILYNIRFWLEKNLANEKHFHDGFVWTYNSSKAFSKLFPYMTSRKISKLLRELESKDVITSGNYNANSYDHTKWYSMPEYALKATYPVIVPKQDNRLSKFGQSVVPKRDNVLTDIKTDIKTDIQIKNKKQKTVGQVGLRKYQVSARISDISDTDW